MPSPSANRWFSRRTLFWLLLYTGLWSLLTGAKGWYIGAPCVLGAAALSVWLNSPPWHIRLRVVPGFLLFFLGTLIAGGWDVARRAVQPRMPLDPAWVSYPLNISHPRFRLLLAAAVGLQPGTLAAAIEGDSLTMHVLDSKLPWLKGVAQLEQQLIRLLGEGHA